MIAFFVCFFSPSSALSDGLVESVRDKVISGIKIICPGCGSKLEEKSKHEKSKKKESTLEVEEIRFHGNNSFPAARLKELMDTREKNVLHPFREAPFDDEVLKEDLERIKLFYQSEGYYDMAVSGYKVEKLTDKSVRIVINVSEGVPTRVRHIALNIKDKLDPALRDTLYNLLPLKENGVFRTESYRDCEKVILRYLAEQGYPKARVDLLARVFQEERKAFVWIDVKLGEKCTFGALKIEGIQYVDAREVKRLITFKRGELFQASKIRESQRKLWDSQLFSFVDITVQGLDREGTELPVLVTVKEAKPYTVKASLGYGTEDGPRGGVGFEARRFLGDARRLSLQAKASMIKQQLELQFLQPHFLTDSWWIDFRGGIGHNDEKSYEAETLFATPQLNIPITSTLRGFIGPNVETNKITNLKIYPYNPDIPDRQKDNYFVSSLIFGFAEERIDDVVNPTRGFRAFATTEWASNVLGSEVSYVKTDLELRTYFPFRTDWVIANRLHWGVISNPQTGSSIPIFKRFFAGGSNSNRGYAYHKLGPLDDLGNALGGLSIIEANTDFRFPIGFIAKDLEGVLFVDIGQVFPDERIMLNDLKYSIGAGLRYKTIVGPIRVDVGYALNPPARNPSSSIQFFLSIGQAF